jgi:hypothetical protein
MSEPMTIGLDLAKNVFQFHGIDAEGKLIARRQLRRGDVLQAVRRLHSQVARRRGDGRHASRTQGQRQPKLGGEATGAQVGETRRRRIGQQDSAHRLGGDDAWRDRRGTRRVVLAPCRRKTVWRGHVREW